MAKDDYFVIAYKVLGVLYASAKSGEPLNLELLSNQQLGISEEYHAYIFSELVSNKYIRGVSVIKYLSGSPKIVFVRPQITQAGIEFLKTNSLMAKARDLLFDSAGLFPSLSAILNL